MLNNILIVEDDELLAARYALFLRSKGVEVIIASSLAEARLHLARLMSLDAVILDNYLSDGAGFSLIALIKKQFIDCTLMMVSGEAEAEFFIHAFEAGIDNYLLKPANLDLLWIKLNKSRASYQLKRVNEQQKQKLQDWVEQEKREHQLAHHVFDALHGESQKKLQYLQVFSFSSSSFCGDIVLQQPAQDGTFYLMLADSMGHGLAAAIALLPLIEVFQAMSRKGLSLAHLVFELNDKLHRQLPLDRFVAAVFVRIDPRIQQIQIWNGGMPSLFLLDQQGAVVAEAASQHMALGILSEQQLDLSLQVEELTAVERIIGYTDGVTDNYCKSGVQLDRKSILALSQKYPDLSAFEQCLDLSVSQQDDMTIFSLSLPSLQQSRACDKTSSISSGALALNLKLEGQMLAFSDTSSQLIRMLQVCDMPQSLCSKAFSVLTELYLNALEHGVLGLNSQLKQEENGFILYYEEKEKRLEKLTCSDFVEVELQWKALSAQIEIMVRDSGSGFLPNDGGLKENHSFSGRGMNLVRTLCSAVEYRGNGNEVRAVING